MTVDSGEWGEAGVGGGAGEVRMKVEQFAALMDEGFVEVDEEGPVALVEGAEVVLQILEEGGVEVAGLEGVPVLALPVAVGADAHVLHQALPCMEGAPVHGDGEVERAIGRVDDAAVAEALLLIVLVLLNQHGFSLDEGEEPRNGREVGGRKNHAMNV